MDEFLFYQSHKNELPEAIRTPSKCESSGKCSFLTTQQDEDAINFTMRSSTFEAGTFKNTFKKSSNDQCFDTQFPASSGQQTPFTEEPVELTEETMKAGLTGLSKNYKDQYINAGFPPKICQLLIKNLSNKKNNLKTEILDIGCGKGYVGQYLKVDGFQQIYGMELSKSLLKMAEEKKCYKSIDKVNIGDKNCTINPIHNDKYDFVVCPTLINNDGWTSEVFQQLRSYAKMGGYIIFSTKLNINEEDQYNQEIKELTEHHYWNFITEHTFYRYDLMCDGTGKFSQKRVKIMVFKKSDNDSWTKEQAEIKAREEAIAAENKLRLEEAAEARRDKLLGAKKRQEQRDARIQKEKDDELALEQATIEEQKMAEEEALKKAEKKKIQVESMKAHFKKFVQDLMWKKLKEIKEKAELELEEKSRAAELKRQVTLMKQKEFMKGIQINRQTIDSVDRKTEGEFNPAG